MQSSKAASPVTTAIWKDATWMFYPPPVDDDGKLVAYRNLPARPPNLQGLYPGWRTRLSL